MIIIKIIIIIVIIIIIIINRNVCIPKALEVYNIGVDNHLIVLGIPTHYHHFSTIINIIIIGDIDEIPSHKGLNILKWYYHHHHTIIIITNTDKV
jgi:hypothetical protein